MGRLIKFLKLSRMNYCYQRLSISEIHFRISLISWIKLSTPTIDETKTKLMIHSLNFREDAEEVKQHNGKVNESYKEIHDNSGIQILFSV